MKAVPETLVLLHGFGGTRRAWDPVVPELDAERYRPVALDLRGHGARAAAPPTFAGCVEDVLGAVAGPFALCGYSLGGRIAQHVALAAPERLTRLVLVATSGGIDDPAARARRRADDEALAADMETMTIEQWADRWQAQPIFAGTPPEAARWWREDLLRNDPRALAAALRGLGTGVMEPLWERLGTLRMPVAVVVGDRDEKFMAYAERYLEVLPAAVRHVIAGAGHGLPREAPRELAAVLAGAS
jgi:2-succinyl-6-hydroxy-2,4-cyclohexadiene-1-carboxylate synthase